MIREKPNNSEKPDFEKMANEYYPDWYSSKEQESIKVDGFKGGCEKIWKDYVIPRDKTISDLRERVKELEDKVL